MIFLHKKHAVITLLVIKYLIYHVASFDLFTTDDDEWREDIDEIDEMEYNEMEDEEEYEFSGPCADSDSQCKIWALGGECHENPNYMRENCPKSCELCGCKDFEKDCQSWADEGDCFIEKEYMDENCPMSCFVCIDEDEDPKWAKKAKIYNALNFGVYQELEGKEAQREKTIAVLKEMEIYARDNLTRASYSGIRDRCQNKEEYCAFWASIGECGRNVEYMNTACPLACLSCENLEGFTPSRDFIKVGMRESFDSRVTLADTMRYMKK